MTEANPEVPVPPVTRPDWRERYGATLRAILIGCGSVCLALLLVAAASIYVLSRDPRGRRLGEGLVFDSLEAEVAGESLPAPVRGELEQAYGRFRRDWSEERISEADGDRARHALLGLTRRQRITATDIQALARKLDSIARTVPPVRR